jgi:hypothetical protein
VGADVFEAERLWCGDQEAEHTVTARERADLLAQFVVDTDREELLELDLVLVEDPERGVAGARDLARHLQHAVEDGRQVELGDE